MIEKFIIKKIIKKTIEQIDKKKDTHLLNLFNTGIVIDLKKIKVSILKEIAKKV